MVSATDSMIPIRWSDYIGQRATKDRLDVHIQSAKARGTRMEHVLFTGPSGTGKTTLAHMVANRLGVPIYATNEPMSVSQLLEVLIMFDGPFVMFLDEIHGYRRAQQDVLLRLVETGTLDTGWGPEPYPDVTIMAATTDANKVTRALRDRFMVQPRFEPYTDTEMTQIVTGMANRTGCTAVITRPVAQALARAAGGKPRVARSLVVAARDLSLAGRDVTADSILDFCGMTGQGLTGDHVAYLTALFHLGGRAGLDQIARRLGVPSDAAIEHEKLLVDHRMIKYTGAGRQLTMLGRQHVTV